MLDTSERCCSRRARAFSFFCALISFRLHKWQNSHSEPFRQLSAFCQKYAHGLQNLRRWANSPVEYLVRNGPSWRTPGADVQRPEVRRRAGSGRSKEPSSKWRNVFFTIKSPPFISLSATWQLSNRMACCVCSSLASARLDLRSSRPVLAPSDNGALPRRPGSIILPQTSGAVVERRLSTGLSAPLGCQHSPSDTPCCVKSNSAGRP